jgi:hypothetical protein
MLAMGIDQGDIAQWRHTGDADAKKSQLDIDPVAPEAVEKTVARFLKLDAVRVGKLREFSIASIRKDVCCYRSLTHLRCEL